MSELEKKVTKKISEIDQAISNPEEKVKVMDMIQDLVKTFTKQVTKLNKHQDALDKKMADIYDMLWDIETELLDALGEDLEATCPYCGEMIPVPLENESMDDFECPACHHMVEFEEILDSFQCDCESCHACEDCDGDCDCEDELLDDKVKHCDEQECQERKSIREEQEKAKKPKNNTSKGNSTRQRKGKKNEK